MCSFIQLKMLAVNCTAHECTPGTLLHSYVKPNPKQRWHQECRTLATEENWSIALWSRALLSNQNTFFISNWKVINPHLLGFIVKFPHSVIFGSHVFCWWWFGVLCNSTSLEHCFLHAAKTLSGISDFVFQADLPILLKIKKYKINTKLTWFCNGYWPASSPELKAVETLWDIFGKMRHQSNNTDNLKVTPQQSIGAVIHAEGAMITYWEHIFQKAVSHGHQFDHK